MGEDLIPLPARRPPDATAGALADPMVRRIIAMLDGMIGGAAIESAPNDSPMPRPGGIGRRPHRLGFVRLVFHPLDPLIVPAPGWQPDRGTIPRPALRPIGQHIRSTMGPAADPLAATMAGHSTLDTDLIARLGRSLWPEAAHALAAATIPPGWHETGLGEPAYRRLADSIAALLAEAPALDTLCSDTEIGLQPATAETIAALLGRVAHRHPSALPMMLTLLLHRLPTAILVLPEARAGQAGAAIQAALDHAADHLLGQLDQLSGGTEARIAAATLAEAGAEASRVATLLAHLDARDTKPQRRDRLRGVRRQLNAGCKARFVSALQYELLSPLRHTAPLAPSDIADLEATSRGLRMLEAASRAVGGGATYDLLLGKTAEAIQKSAMRDRLTPTDQVRLVEILTGPDAALAMLESA
ncbi:MAG TPA: hypothetical protein VFG12_04045 [Rhodopila sp.]|nr:hypothetical protein [Rhodopila sp.]